MDSLNFTSLSDAFPFSATAIPKALRFGFTLLFLQLISIPLFSQVVINEVVTDPQQDWDTNGFNGTTAGGAVTASDEWIELYITADGLNLTGWTIEVNDGGTFSGDLTSHDISGTGAFQQITYFGSGSFTNTQAGDYLVLGDPLLSEEMDGSVYIILRDNTPAVIDEIELGSDPQGDGAGDEGPIGDAAGVDDESVGRIANGTDTGNDINDLREVISTMGSENGRSTVFVDATAPDDTGLGTVGNPKQLIQSGIDLALTSGTVTVAGGDYTENVTISKVLTLNGANQGTAGNGSRTTESLIDPGSLSTAITVSANDVTIDGMQIGTNASTSMATGGITAAITGGISVVNNVVYANSSGISVIGSATGTINVSNNLVSMLAVEDATNPFNGSLGIVLSSISGDADANITTNDLTNAGAGISTYSLTSSTDAVIDGGTYTGCMIGILPVNFDGMGNFSASTLTIQNVTMSGFFTDTDVTSPDTESGIYVVTAGGSGGEDISVTIDNVDISGVGNGRATGASNNAGIIIGDFGADGVGIMASITNSNIHDNENRGIFTRGDDAVTNITQCSVTGNGFNPHAVDGNHGFSIISRNSAATTVSNCTITNPSSLSGPVPTDPDDAADYYTSGLHVSVGGSLSLSDCSLSNNGNGFIAETSGIDISGNYFNTTDEATILSLAGSGNDFTPWLSSGTDTDLVTEGFQGDFSSLIVGVSGAQTGGTGRIEEAIGLVDAGGSVLVNAGTYAENLTILKSVTLNGANQGIAGSGSRSAETIIEPGGANVGITIGAADITIDGFQFGTNNTTSNNTTGISNTGFAGFAGNNNRIFANSNGILINGITSGTVSLSDNYVEMLGLANPLLTSSPSVGIAMFNISGTADADLLGNDISTATYGVATFGLTSGTVPEIDGGSYSGCTIGISSSNFDGSVSFSESTLNISNVTMSGFTGPAGSITGASGIPQAGIYAFTTANATSINHDLTITADAVDISGVGSGATDHAAIHAADFFDVDPDLEVSDDKGITMTVSNSNIHDNLNRGVHSRGGDAVVTINTSTISNNTNAGGVVFARGTLNINNSFIILPSSGATDGVLAQADGQIVVNGSSFDLNGNADASTLIADIQDPAGDETIDLSGSWLTTTDETTIISLVDESDTDFSPWLGSGTDSDAMLSGFQPDSSTLFTGFGGSQSVGLLTEAHDFVSDGGTITTNAGTYAEIFTVSKNIVLSPVSGTSIDDLVLNGGNLNIQTNTITVNNALTMTSGIFDIDQEDGNKDDDPVFILPATVNGSSYGADTYFEGRIEQSVTGASSFTFEVGDEGAYRPATLTPANTTTFQVAHIAEATPAGAGMTNPDITNLIGDASANPSGNVQSVLNFRYWDIDVSGGGPPGSTNVGLQISSADRATDPSFLGMTRFDGTDWGILPLFSSGGMDPYIITGTTTAFSEFSIYSINSAANPLPVELIGFSGRKENDKNLLLWTTLSELNSDYFLIERAEDGIAFSAIGTVSSHGTSNERRDYQFVDNDVILSRSYFYRLKMVDFDGTYEYSETILVTPDFSNSQILVYPNPSKDFIEIKGVDVNNVNQLILYDLDGSVVRTSSSIKSRLIPMFDLPDGQYLLRIEMIDKSVFEGKIIKK